MTRPGAGPSTTAIHVGQSPDAVTGAIVPPPSLATTFVMDEVGVPRAGYDYARSGNPTRAALEDWPTGRTRPGPSPGRWTAGSPRAA